MDPAMSNESNQRNESTDGDAPAAGAFDTALIPHEENEDPKDTSANRAKAGADPETEARVTGAGDENTDPNAQPPA